eukprot:CAMPEP_0198570458 /NCGR_PEP_ID=MMETSP1462-20131121/109147_1 /TAXON_ID=1333877 /ORGANISM="Brandtodinium nutriculum, Strain RCC3387" /LENGTH=49 /DNA_ID= /DNA_START= /DNA_END= /DNA_ORIENTATION=
MICMCAPLGMESRNIHEQLAIAVSTNPANALESWSKNESNSKPSSSNDW